MQDLTIDQLNAAVARLHVREEISITHRNRIKQLEAGATQKHIRFALGEIDAVVLDADLEEITRLKAIPSEDLSEAFQHFARIETKLKAEIHTQERIDQSRAEIMTERRKWAIRYNAILSGTKGFSLDELALLAGTRPQSIPGSDWHRFTTHRAAYGSLPDADKIPYGEFCNVPIFDSEA